MIRRNTTLAIALTAAAAILATLGTLLLSLPPAVAATPAAAPPPDSIGLGWGLLAAAIATSASSLGAGYAVAVVGSAAVGALAEKPELLGRVLILVGLAEGIAIYGVLISILILNRVT